MKKLSKERKLYEALATELNSFLGLNPPIDIDIIDKQLVEQIKQAELLIFETDELPKSLKLKLYYFNVYQEGTWRIPKVVTVLISDLSFDDPDLEDDKVYQMLKDEDDTVPKTTIMQDDLEDMDIPLPDESDVEELEKKAEEVITKVYNLDEDQHHLTMPRKRGRPKKTWVTPDEVLIERMLKKIVVKETDPKAKKFRHRRGKRRASAYAVGIEMFCKDPERNVIEVYEELVRRKIKMPERNDGERAAQIIVKKIVKLLRQNGLMIEPLPKDETLNS
jgi:hypothetical protein